MNKKQISFIECINRLQNIQTISKGSINFIGDLINIRIFLKYGRFCEIGDFEKFKNYDMCIRKNIIGNITFKKTVCWTGELYGFHMATIGIDIINKNKPDIANISGTIMICYFPKSNKFVIFIIINNEVNYKDNMLEIYTLSRKEFDDIINFLVDNQDDLSKYALRNRIKKIKFTFFINKFKYYVPIIIILKITANKLREKLWIN